MPHSRTMVGRWRSPGDVAGQKGTLGGARHPTGKPPAATPPGDGFTRRRNKKVLGCVCSTKSVVAVLTATCAVLR